MKLLLLPSACLLVSCAATDTGPSATGSDREDVERKLIGFQEKFDRFDYNGDGYLTRSEVSNGIKNEDVEGITDTDLSTIFDYYDTNRDSRISLAEVNAAQEAGPDAAIKARDAE